MSSNNSGKYVAKGGNQNRGGNNQNRSGNQNRGGNGGNRGGYANSGNHGGSRNNGNRGYGGEQRYTSLDQVKKAWRRDMIQNPASSKDEFLKNKSVQAFLNTDPTALGDLLSYMKGTRDEFAHHSRECLKTARMWESQGLYPWADQWKRYAKNPDGEYPKCLHEDLKKGMFTYTDRNTGIETVDYEGYQRLLNKGSGRFGKEPCWGGGHRTFSPDEPRRDELSNAELGEIREEDPRKRDGKTHPMRLIAKLKELQKKYPEIYKKDDNYVTAQ